MSSQTPPLKATRRRRTLDEARSLSAAWRASGMSKEGWCRERGLLRSSLESCLIRVMQADVAERAGFIPVMPLSKRPPAPAPVAIQEVASDQASGLTVLIGDRLRVSGLDLAGVVDLARRLGAAEP